MNSDHGSVELPVLVFLGVISTLIAAANFVGIADGGAERLVLWAAACGIVEIPGRLSRIERHLGIEPQPEEAG